MRVLFNVIFFALRARVATMASHPCSSFPRRRESSFFLAFGVVSFSCLALSAKRQEKCWIPAYARMTIILKLGRPIRTITNPLQACTPDLASPAPILLPASHPCSSFPRRRESSFFLAFGAVSFSCLALSAKRQENRWIPAYAGMTIILKLGRPIRTITNALQACTPAPILALPAPILLHQPRSCFRHRTRARHSRVRGNPVSFLRLVLSLSRVWRSERSAKRIAGSPPTRG